MKPPKADGGTYRCTFSDEFDGRSVNTSKWVIADTAKSGYRLNETCFSDASGTVKVRGGELQLITAQSRTPFTCRSPHGDFTAQYDGAGLSTWGRFAQAYGRFEARIRYPDAVTAGLHGNFWLNPAERAYGAWPHSGEIDVAEWFSAVPDHAYPSLHYSGRTKADTGWNCVVGDASAYHTYAVEWTPTVMHFFYDGNLCFSRSWSPNAPLVAPQPFDKPFHVALTHAAGGLWNAPAAETAYPATMYVDHVRIWS